MFNWIGSVVNFFTSNVADPVINFVKSLINGVYGFLHQLNLLVHGAWNDLWSFGQTFATGLYHFIESTTGKIWHILKDIVPFLHNLILTIYHTVLKVIDEVRQFLWNKILWVYHWADTFIRWLWNWVIVHVWDPLWGNVVRLWDWILHEGAMMFHYFTHLAEFAELLFWHLIRSLESHAWDAAEMLGKFLISLIVRNVVRFAHLMEAIIDAIL